MRIIEKVEEELLALTSEQRLANLKDIAYFVQCAAQMKKANGNGENNPLSEDV